MKSYCKAEILEMAENDIFCVKQGGDHDSAMETWLRSFFVEL